MDALTPAELPFIYNLFPPLAGDVAGWMPHVERAASMGFNWVFLNPLQFPGESGSLYSVHDHDKLNPDFFPQEAPEAQFAALGEFVAASRAAGVEVMIDLVVNHTAHDAPLIKEHPDWFKWNDDGGIAHPGAMDNGHWVLWGDLAEINNESPGDKWGLYEFWWQMVKQMIDLGVRGFRCDAAYKIPSELWRLLIGRAKDIDTACTFFAESLGCPFEDNLRLTRDGFDYTFNSGKWWDYRQDWYLSQLHDSAGRTRSICFPESHDTERLMEEYRGDVARVKQHAAFTALITSGTMIVSGFEFGFTKQVHVVHTKPSDWEEVTEDLSGYITELNALKAGHRVFQEDNFVERIDNHTENIMALKKTTLDHKQSVILLLNLYGKPHASGRGRLRELGFGGDPLFTMNAEFSDEEISLAPWGFAIIPQEG